MRNMKTSQERADIKIGNLLVNNVLNSWISAYNNICLWDFSITLTTF